MQVALLYKHPRYANNGTPMTDLHDESEMATEAGIARALEKARARIASAERDRAELDRSLAIAREEERLLQRLLALRRGETVNVEQRQEVVAEIAARAERAADGKSPVITAAIAELSSAGHPIHVSELMRLLSRKGVRVPGAGTQANLITYLRRDERIVRPSRGMYALAIWGLENMPAKPSRRRRKRMRATAVSRSSI